MNVTPDDPTVATGGTDQERRRLAREMADELLGRGAGIARASIKPLGIVGRLALIAGLVIWAAGPSPLWDNPPHLVFSLVALAFFAFPGMRLLRHRSRMQTVLEDLPTLLDNVTSVMSMTNDLGDLHTRWQQSGAEAKGGLIGVTKRCFRFYRHDLAPFRERPGKLLGQVNDALSAFGAPALILSGIAMLLAVAFLALAPLAVIIRLILLAN